MLSSDFHCQENNSSPLIMVLMKSGSLFVESSMSCSSNIVRLIQSRRLRWAGHVARMEESRSAFKIVILEWTLKRYVSMWVIGLIQLVIWIIGELL